MNKDKSERFPKLLWQIFQKGDKYELSSPEYIYFWESIEENCEFVVLFVSEIIRSIINYENNKKIPKSINVD